MKNMMKKIFINIALLVFGSLLATGCIEEYGGVGEPVDKVNELAGTWKLASVIQVDEDAVRKGFPAFVQTMDITEIFDYTDYTMNLEVSGGAPSSFTIDRGNSPAIIGITSGPWTLDNLQAPTQIIFADSEALEFESYLELREGVLSLRFTRYQTNSKGEKSAFLSYRYRFIKQ